MSFDKDIAHIVYASDNKFAEVLGVSMVSLFENSKDMNNIIIYILDSGITNINKKRIECVRKSYDRSLPIWIKAKDISKELSMGVSIDRGSLSQYARLFISSDLPKELHRVLYLDCDTLINKSIKELWNLDIHGKTIAAIMDAFSSFYRMNINLHSNDTMFNSGVMLIDLDKWREQDIEKKLLYFIGSKNGKIQQCDQGALNAVLSYDTYCFEPYFNSVSIYYDFSYKGLLKYRKPPKFYSKKQIKTAIEEPYIIHFTTSFLSRRPWIEGCKHPYVDEWLKFKKMTPWVNKSLWKFKYPQNFQGIYMRLIKFMPRKLTIALSGLLQSYGRPILLKLMEKVKFPIK